MTFAVTTAHAIEWRATASFNINVAKGRSAEDTVEINK